MRRLGISVAVVLAGLVLLPAAAAQATFHLNKVNEVMLASASGDSNVRFVEYFDPSSEPYPPTFAPYGLAIYDAAGHKLGSQTLTASTKWWTIDHDAFVDIRSPDSDCK